MRMKGKESSDKACVIFIKLEKKVPPSDSAVSACE